MAKTRFKTRDNRKPDLDIPANPDREGSRAYRCYYLSHRERFKLPQKSGRNRYVEGPVTVYRYGRYPQDIELGPTPPWRGGYVVTAEVVHCGYPEDWAGLANRFQPHTGHIFVPYGCGKTLVQLWRQSKDCGLFPESIKEDDIVTALAEGLMDSTHEPPQPGQTIIIKLRIHDEKVYLRQLRRSTSLQTA